MNLQQLYENPNFGIYLIIIIGVLLVLFFFFLIMALKDAKKNKKAMENNQPVAEISPTVDNSEVAYNNETPMYQMDIPNNNPQESNSMSFDMGMNAPVEPVTFNPVASPEIPVTEIPPVTNDFRINNDYSEVTPEQPVEPTFTVEPNPIDISKNIDVEQNDNTNQEAFTPVVEENKPVLEPIKSPEIIFHTPENETTSEVKLEQTSIFDQPISFETDIESKEEENINELNKLIEERMTTIEKISTEDNNTQKNHQFSSVFVDEPKPLEENNTIPKVNFNELETSAAKPIELPKVRDIPAPKAVEQSTINANLDDLVNNAYK